MSRPQAGRFFALAWEAVRHLLSGILAAGLMLGATVRPASAQILTSLPDSNQTTTLTAIVSEQARVSVPANVTLLVNDVTLSTDSPETTLRLSNIVLPAASGELRILIRAAAPSFDAPTPGGATWSAHDVSWTAASWMSGTSTPGHLIDSGFTPVAVCTANASACGTDDLVFTLAPRSTVASGPHTIALIWKFEIVNP